MTGYKRALALGVDAAAVMAADNQMDPDELEEMALPVVRGELDYAKANRLFTGRAWAEIPHSRYLGNATLSLFTKIASGYWHVADSQAGYTVISRRMLELLDLDRIYRSYGFPNDMLVHLNVWNAKVRDVPSRPIYGVGERSGIKIRKVVPRISWLLWKGFFWRLREKYVIRDFHPLVFFYLLGFLMTHRRPRARDRRDGSPPVGQPHHAGHDRPGRAAADLRQPVHALRHVVRHGVEQRPALSSAAQVVSERGPSVWRSRRVVATNRSELPYGRETSRAPSRVLMIACASSRGGSVKSRLCSCLPSIRTWASQVSLCVEELDHGVAHRLGERPVLGGEHAAEAHPFDRRERRRRGRRRLTSFAGASPAARVDLGERRRRSARCSA